MLLYTYKYISLYFRADFSKDVDIRLKEGFISIGP